jgi:prolyl-tRNA synthetase
VFNTHEEAERQIEEDLGTCNTVINGKLKIPFLYFKRPQWDKFKGADYTFTPDTLMPDGKRNQLASTHDLGQNFSKAFDIKVKDESGEDKLVWQTCFGPGIWRIMAAIIGIHGDDKGLVLPFDIAPLQIVIVPIIFSDKKSESERVISKCREIEKNLESEGYRAKFDGGEESPGFKFNKWELMGVPLRIELGPKELENKTATLVKRTERGKIQAKLGDLEKEVRSLSLKIDQDIKAKADKYFEDNTRGSNSLNDLKMLIKKHRGFIKVPFCSVDMAGEKCADILKSETEGGNVCGTLYPKEEAVKPHDKCIVCGNKAKHIVYVAKSY